MNHSAVTRRRAIQALGGLGVFAALPLSRAWAEAGGPSLSFLAVGDWGREGAFHQSEVAMRMAESARELDARFVISVGDNFYENGVTGIDDPAWQKSFEAIYDAPSLQIPWHVALGNHDYRGNVQAQLDYTARSARWRLPARWYTYRELTPDGAAVDFFVTDTSPMISGYYQERPETTNVTGERANVPAQLAWLDEALGRSRAEWKIVIGHHPVYAGVPRGSRESRGSRAAELAAGSSPDLIAQLDPILQRHRVPLYLNGHNHDLQHTRRGATHFVCTGAGSKLADHCNLIGSDFCSLRSGFVAIAVNRDLLRVAYRDRTGVELHVTEIPAAFVAHRRRHST